MPEYYLEEVTKTTISILIGLVALAIGYQLAVRYLTSLGQNETWIGFIAQLFLYIPCIIYELWVKLLIQFRLTPYAIYGFILLEIILIILYFYLPTLSKSITGIKNGKQLLYDVYFLNKGPRTLATSDDLKLTPSNEDASKGVKSAFRVNYALSMWVYINPQNSSSVAYQTESNLFTYGYTDASGIQHVKPMIRYYGGGDATDQPIERNKYVFYFARYPPVHQYDTDEATFYDVTMPNQRWNQIVLNYNGNIVDLFINGNLERSFEMNRELPLYGNLDTITVGSVDGLDGAICNVAYYDFPMTKEQIAFSYNAFVGMNPPVATK